jgi:hypothetical protein
MVSRSNSLRALFPVEKSSLPKAVALDSLVFVSVFVVAPGGCGVTVEEEASPDFWLVGLRGKRKSCSVIEVDDDAVWFD